MEQRGMRWTSFLLAASIILSLGCGSQYSGTAVAVVLLTLSCVLLALINILERWSKSRGA
jgi:ABC-type sulfate transport system permease component